MSKRKNARDARDTKDTKSRIGMKWDREEDEQLMGEMGKMSIEEIAKEHRRTETGVKARMVTLAIAMITNGDPIEEVAERIGMTVEELKKEQIIKSMKSPALHQLQQQPDDRYMEILIEIRDMLKDLRDPHWREANIG